MKDDEILELARVDFFYDPDYLVCEIVSKEYHHSHLKPILSEHSINEMQDHFPNEGLIICFKPREQLVGGWLRMKRTDIFETRSYKSHVRASAKWCIEEGKCTTWDEFLNEYRQRIRSEEIPLHKHDEGVDAVQRRKDYESTKKLKSGVSHHRAVDAAQRREDYAKTEMLKLGVSHHDQFLNQIRKSMRAIAQIDPAMRYSTDCTTPCLREKREWGRKYVPWLDANESVVLVSDSGDVSEMGPFHDSSEFELTVVRFSTLPEAQRQRMITLALRLPLLKAG